MQKEHVRDTHDTLTQYGLGDNTLPIQYFKWIEELLQSAPDRVDSPLTEDSHPFLSVIMRTQGKREQMLREVLLCMQGQTDTDYEIILILHNGDENGKRSVETLLHTQPEEMRQRIRYYELSGGTRTAPLNYGASVARGEYFAMLDDDDLVFDNWVENYHHSAIKNAGRVIRAYGCTQVWTAKEQPDGTVILRSDSSTDNRYCQPFDLIAHLNDNHTPISCVAIPALCYHALGLRFDDNLTTAEDWDFIMRCILTVGVYDTRRLTFIYRLWNGAESSRTLHKPDEWDQNRHSICKKLNELPILTTRRQLLQSLSLQAGTPFSASLPTAVRVPTSFPSLCKHILALLRGWVKLRFRLKQNLQIIASSPLFDADWYLRSNPDVQGAGIDPVRHYLLHGWSEGRDPSEDFSTSRYLMRYPDVAAAGICPLLHYETKGRSEDREID